MKLLANENVAGDAVELLRARGHDVLWARTAMPGAADQLVLARSQSEARVLVTFDKDFGELVFARGESASCGVILLRIHAPSPGALATKIAGLIEFRSDWQGHFTVVEEGRYRMTPLPRTSP